MEEVKSYTVAEFKNEKENVTLYHNVITYAETKKSITTRVMVGSIAVGNAADDGNGLTIRLYKMENGVAPSARTLVVQAIMDDYQLLG